MAANTERCKSHCFIQLEAENSLTLFPSLVPLNPQTPPSRTHSTEAFPAALFLSLPARRPPAHTHTLWLASGVVINHQSE